jgi:hypothetical protein
MTASALRWGRILLGGFLAEVILIVVIIPLQATGSSESAIAAAAVAGSYFVFVPVAWWLGRSLARPVLHGVLMGVAAAALYTLLGIVGRFLVPDAPPTPLIYYVAHVLKLAGGATGGWLATRRTVAAGSARVG